MKNAERTLRPFVQFLTKRISKIAKTKVKRIRLIKKSNPKYKDIYGQVYLDSRIIDICIRDKEGHFVSIKTLIDTIIHEITHLLCWDKYKSEMHDSRFYKEKRKLEKKVNKEIISG